jgi:hypothetical protein
MPIDSIIHSKVASGSAYERGESVAGATDDLFSRIFNEPASGAWRKMSGSRARNRVDKSAHVLNSKGEFNKRKV